MNRFTQSQRLTLLSTLLAALFLIAACGQSGALFIPGDPSQMTVPPTDDLSDTQDQETDDGTPDNNTGN